MDWWSDYASLKHMPLAHCVRCDVGWSGRPESACWLCGSEGPHEPMFPPRESMLGDAYTPLTHAA